MINVKENALEWALKHLRRYYDSDFYPKPFEFDAISHNWNEVKKYILSLDLEKYVPKSPVINLAPKANRTYRVTHQLDPIDSLIYTALVYELSDIIEDYRIPESENIACSYRIKTDVNGSFFNTEENGWKTFVSKSEELSQSYKNGYVLTADITDFYNQIYTHRVENIVSEAGGGLFDPQAKVLETFLLGLNTQTSRGIPVGPTASIVLAEAVMGDLDKKIMNYTRDFVRWVDDIRIFLKSEEEASLVLHSLTRYLYTSHRLVFSGEKTFVLPVPEFMEKYFRDEEKEEDNAVLKETEEFVRCKLNEIIDDSSSYDMGDIDYDEIYEEIAQERHFEILARVYYDLLNKSLRTERIDVALMRHIFRKATRYRIRSIVPLVFENFDKLIPVIREIIIYLNKVLNEELVRRHKNDFETILTRYYMKIPFVNIWISYLLQNENFNSIDFPANYDEILRDRDKALMAKRRNDKTWVKEFRDGLDVLGPWDKRAVLFSSSILSEDEMRYWIKIASARGDILDKSISSYLISTGSRST